MVNGVYSEFKTITHRVPQGSVLGPLWFLLYINDFTTVVDPNSIYLYADDTVLVESDVYGMKVQTKLQSKIDVFTQWCKMNKLTMNIKKTKVLNFQLSRQHNV